MMAHKILALILILSSCITFSYSTCRIIIKHRYSLRGEHNYIIDCSNINLDKETKLIQTYDNLSFKNIQIATYLEFTESTISEINNDTFEGFDFVSLLSLNNVSLHKTDPNVFVNWKKLNSLILSYNYLTTLDFHLPQSLEYLNISHNELSHINNFKNYHNLVKLDLSYNRIIYINNFGPLNVLSHLDLSHNYLRSFANTTFLIELRMDLLNLSHNNLKSIPKNIELLSIANLDLSYNNISTFNCTNVNNLINVSNNNFTEFCNFSKQIEIIDFSYNALTHIYVHTFKNLEKLKFLKLSSNNIEAIYPGAFHDLIKLNVLNLSVNSIAELPKGLFYHLSNLEMLDISTNNIETLEHGTFTGITNLESLYINNNKIDNLDAVYTLHYLRKLNIIDNNISQLDVDQITKHLPSLNKFNFNIRDISCKELMIYLLKLRAKFVQVEKGDFKNINNVHGMRCHSASDDKIEKLESNEQRMALIANYLSGICVTFIIILVVLVLIIMCTSFTLYQVYIKHRKQTNIDHNLHNCNLKLLSEEETLN